LRKTTGSVVSAYPAELDEWRRRLGARVTSDPESDVRDQEADNADTAETATSPAPHRATARHAWFLAVVVLVTSASAAVLWVRSREAVVDPPRQEQNPARGVPPTVTLSCTRDSTTVRLQVREGDLAALVLPGMPELRIRAIRVDSQLKVELYRRPLTSDPSDALVRLAKLLLLPHEAGRLVLAGRPIDIAWDTSAQ
jgi:hypothetical protein